MNVYLGDVVHFDATTHDPTQSGSPASDADSPPTFDVFEEANDTPILAAQAMTKRTGLVGDYRGSATASTGNGFEITKYYNVVAIATVNGVTGKATLLTFRVDAVPPSVQDVVDAITPYLSTLPTKTAAVVDDASNSATTFKTDLTETANDHWKDALCKITSGALSQQVKRVTAYNGTTKFITVAGGFTAEPAADVTIEIIND